MSKTEPEPLKGKQMAMNMGEPCKMVYFHADKHIHSAVEWLKRQEIFITIKPYKNPCFMCGVFCKIYYKIRNKDFCTHCGLDEAFEDVMNKK